MYRRGIGDNGAVPDDPAMRAQTIDVERDGGLRIVFGDGHECSFGLLELRTACPCAACRGARDQGQAAFDPATMVVDLRIENAELVGEWGLRFAWNDGHGTGIYPFDLLRSWCPPTTAP